MPVLDIKWRRSLERYFQRISAEAGSYLAQGTDCAKRGLAQHGAGSSGSSGWWQAVCRDMGAASPNSGWLFSRISQDWRLAVDVAEGAALGSPKEKLGVGKDLGREQGLSGCGARGQPGGELGRWLQFQSPVGVCKHSVRAMASSVSQWVCGDQGAPWGPPATMCSSACVSPPVGRYHFPKFHCTTGIQICLVYSMDPKSASCLYFNICLHGNSLYVDGLALTSTLLSWNPHPFFYKIFGLVAHGWLWHAALPVIFVLVKDHSVFSPLTDGKWPSASLLVCCSIAGSGQSLSNLSRLHL